MLNPPGVDKAALARQYVLDKIASGESTSYNELFGGHQVSDLSSHPNVRVAIPGEPGHYSTAAGRYQFLKGTWDEQAAKLGLTDFSPASQDAAAWDLANTTYAKATGRDLESDASAKVVDWSALGGQWSSLKRGGTAPAGGFSTDIPDQHLVPPEGGGGNPALVSFLMAQLGKSYTLSPVDYDPFAVQEKISGGASGG